MIGEESSGVSTTVSRNLVVVAVGSFIEGSLPRPTANVVIPEHQKFDPFQVSPRGDNLVGREEEGEELLWKVEPMTETP